MERMREVQARMPQARELATQLLDRAWAVHQRPLDLVFRGPAEPGKRLALTFDDGPSRANTEKVLNLLAESGARATFFAVGSRVSGLEDILRRAVDAGHELANHTYSHVHTVSFTRKRLLEDIAQASCVIEATAGRNVRLLRPPFGKDRRRTVVAGRELGMITVLWSLDSGDAMGSSRNEIVEAISTRARPGAIVLMHDGGLERPATLGALETVLPRLRTKGYELVTVSELLRLRTD
jgi:peptidoglycan/xylan/chitin deacetylase (PgdA/CDA1 family)